MSGLWPSAFVAALTQDGHAVGAKSGVGTGFTFSSVLVNAVFVS
jgi:hypothetical protein